MQRSLQGTVHHAKEPQTTTDLGKVFFTSAPNWVKRLFTLRNTLVSLLGLKTPQRTKDRETQLKSFKGEPGEQLGLFKVFEKNENEVILGEDDKHLNFRVSRFLHPQNPNTSSRTVTLSTVVQFQILLEGPILFLCCLFIE
ncbi:MAG: DUF2867 domain-containing protein [Bacteroidota bacterium]